MLRLGRVVILALSLVSAAACSGTRSGPIDVSVGQRWLDEGVYQFALNPNEQPLISEVPDGLSLTMSFTGPMEDASDRWCPGLRLVDWREASFVAWPGAVLCLDIHRAAELSRTIRTTHEEIWATHDVPYTTGRLFDMIVASLRLGPEPSAGDKAP